jgi:lipoprotein signal peptidase
MNPFSLILSRVSNITMEQWSNFKLIELFATILIERARNFDIYEFKLSIQHHSNTGFAFSGERRRLLNIFNTKSLAVLFMSHQCLVSRQSRAPGCVTQSIAVS